MAKWLDCEAHMGCVIDILAATGSGQLGGMCGTLYKDCVPTLYTEKDKGKGDLYCGAECRGTTVPINVLNISSGRI